MNLSCSYAADSKGFGNLRGGKYRGFFTSSTTASFASSPSYSGSTSLPSIPIFLAPLLVELGATIVWSFFLLSSLAFTLSLFKGLLAVYSWPGFVFEPALYPYLSLLIVFKFPLLPTFAPILFLADSLYLCLSPFISFIIPSFPFLFIKLRVKLGSRFSIPILLLAFISLKDPWPIWFP